MDNTQTRRHEPAGMPLSSRLLRSRSGTPAISLPELQAFTSNLGQKTIISRSKSTTKSRINKDDENVNPSMKPQENKDCYVKFMQLSPRNFGATTMRARSVSGSPSAWALSPGRSLPCSPLPEKPSSGGLRVKSGGCGGGGGGMSGVLKYFRKKVFPIQEEEFHRFRVLHNRLLQWRFANARAEAAMAAVKLVTEDKLFSAWLRIFKMRNCTVEKRIQMQTLKHEIKLFQNINPEICLLNEWTKLERRNCEAVGKLARKLSALPVRLPLVQGLEADVVSVYEAMSTAMEVMDGIEAIITKFLFQVEKICYMLTELGIIVKQQKECLEELSKSKREKFKGVSHSRSYRVQERPR